MTEKRMIQPRMSSVARRDFLQYLGVAGVLVSSSGLMGGCGQSSTQKKDWRTNRVARPQKQTLWSRRS